MKQPAPPPPDSPPGEELDAFLDPEELAAIELLRVRLGVDAARTSVFWEYVVAALTAGDITGPQCPWDVEVPYGEGLAYDNERVLVEVKFSTQFLMRFNSGVRPVFKFAAPKGTGQTEKPPHVIVLVGLDDLDRVHAWVLPSTAVGKATSITLTVPSARRTARHSQAEMDAYACPLLQVLPEVLRAYRSLPLRYDAPGDHARATRTVRETA